MQRRIEMLSITERHKILWMRQINIKEITGWILWISMERKLNVKSAVSQWDYVNSRTENWFWQQCMVLGHSRRATAFTFYLPAIQKAKHLD